MKTETHRINLNLNRETLDVIDAFAAMNDRSRTYVIEELLKPSLPALRELLKLSDDLKTMSDADRLTVLSKLSNFSDSVASTSRSAAPTIKGISK